MFADSPFAEAWQQFESKLTSEKKENTVSPAKEVRCGSLEALAIYRKKILDRQVNVDRESMFLMEN